MPTFKADYAEYDPQLSAEDNLLELFNRHNELIQRVSRTVNNLDEENLSTLLNNKSSESEDSNT